MQPSAELQALVQAILVGGILFFAVGDLLILILYVVGHARGQALLARYWSVADLFLSLQAVLGLLVFLSLFLMVFVLVVTRGSMAALQDPGSPWMIYGLLLPLFLWQQVALVAVPAVIVWMKYRGTVQDLGIRSAGKNAWRLLGGGALLAVALIPVSDLLETVFRRLVVESGRLPYSEALSELAKQANALMVLESMRSHTVALVLLALIVGIIGPVAEEVFFRGFAYRVLKERFGVAAGIGLSALLFAAIHMNPVALVPIFVIGLVLAWLYEYTGSLAAPIGLHCANNSLALLFYFVAPEFSLWDRFFPK